MRVPLHWLAEYCDPGLDPSELATRLAMTGTEVDRIHHHGVANLDAFVVGRVLSTEPHPDADRLTVCRVLSRRAPRHRSSAERPTWPPVRRSPSHAPGPSCPMGRS